MYLTCVIVYLSVDEVCGVTNFTCTFERYGISGAFWYDIKARARLANFLLIEIAVGCSASLGFSEYEQ